MTNWEAILKSDKELNYYDPVSEEELANLMDFAGEPLPNIYVEFLKFSNGLEQYSEIIWSAERVIEAAAEFASDDWRDSFMNFDSMFVFGSDANGDYFFFPKLLNSIEEAVFVWRHEDDSRVKVSRSFTGFLKKYLSGEYDAWKP